MQLFKADATKATNETVPSVWKYATGVKGGKKLHQFQAWENMQPGRKMRAAGARTAKRGKTSNPRKGRENKQVMRTAKAEKHAASAKRRNMLTIHEWFCWRPYSMNKQNENTFYVSLFACLFSFRYCFFLFRNAKSFTKLIKIANRKPLNKIKYIFILPKYHKLLQNDEQDERAIRIKERGLASLHNYCPSSYYELWTEYTMKSFHLMQKVRRITNYTFRKFCLSLFFFVGKTKEDTSSGLQFSTIPS